MHCSLHIFTFKYYRVTKGVGILFLQLAVEVANILGFASATNIYPRQFVLVTDVLDEFGHLVYDRLYTKANKERAESGLNQLPDNFTVDDVPKQTRDVARNWFCKIGDINDFLPRFYG